MRPSRATTWTSCCNAGGAGGLFGSSNAFIGRDGAVGPADAAGDGSVVFSWTPGASAHATFTASANPAPGGRSVTFTDTIVPTSVTSALTVGPNPVVPGDNVTFTDRVTSGGDGATPTGAVTFEEYNPSTVTFTPLGTADLTSGVATWTTTGLAVGSHVVYAIYAGDAMYGGVSSLSVTEVVEAAVVSVAGSANPVAFGPQLIGTTQTQVVTLTNNGNVAVTFNGSADTTNADVNMPATNCFGTLAPGASCTVTISFAPSVAGPDNGTITLSGTDSVALSVTGVGVGVPTVASVSPRSGRKAGGTTITISGHGLSDVTAIAVAGVPVQRFSCPSASRCTAVTAPGTGRGPVLVTNIAGTSPATPGAQFRYR